VFYDNTISYNNNNKNNNIAKHIIQYNKRLKKSIIKYKKNENIEKSPSAKNG
jgi:hypothetical protein